jgi:hypothetical protein
MKAKTGMHMESIVRLKPGMCQKNYLWTTSTWSKQTAQLWLKITSVQWIKPDIKNNKKGIKFLEEWTAKILCWDNDYVKNKANSDDETKKRFKRTKKHGPNQYAMIKRSYKPINQEARSNINIVNFTPQQQWQKAPDQLFLHLSDFMKGEIETMTKTADKKNANQKNIKLLNSASEVAACLVELANKDRHKKFSSLEEMQAYMREQVSKQKKRPANESSEDTDDNDE